MDDLNEFSLEVSNIISNSNCKRRELTLREIKLLLACRKNSSNSLVDIPKGLTWFGVTRPLTRDDLNGKIVVLDFFTYCCMNCIHILPHLKALEDKYKDNPVVTVIGVHSPKFPNEKDDVNLQNALIKLDISHPVVNDPDIILSSSLDVICWPTLFVLSPKGEPILTLIGEGHHEELDIFIEASVQFYRMELNTTALPVCEIRESVTSSLLRYPGAIDVAADGTLAVADTGHHRILLISSDGVIKEAIGEKGDQEGTFGEAKFQSPQGVIFYNNDELFVADTGNHKIRHFDLLRRVVKTVVGTGAQLPNNSLDQGGRTGREQPISSPWGLCIVPAPTPIPSAPALPPPETPSRHTASSGVPPPPPLLSKCAPVSLGPPPPPPPTVLNAPLPPPAPPTNLKLPPCSITSGIGDSARSSDVLLIAMSGCHQIWAYFLEDTMWWKNRFHNKDSCCAVVGSGKEENRNNLYPLSAGLAQPAGLSYVPSRRSLFIADSESSTVRCVHMDTGVVAAVVGGDTSPQSLFAYGDADGSGTSAKLQHPLDVAWDEKTQSLYVIDTYNGKLKNIDVDKRKCTTVMLQTLHEPGGICIYEDTIYISDTNAHRLLAVSLRNWAVKEMEVKFAKPAPLKSKARHLWELTLPVNPEGTSVKLIMPLVSYTGRWRVAADSPAGILLTRQNGIIDGDMTVELSTKEAEEVSFDVDLAGCNKDVCVVQLYKLTASAATAIGLQQDHAISDLIVYLTQNQQKVHLYQLASKRLNLEHFVAVKSNRHNCKN